jgi:hypothetical protein
VHLFRSSLSFPAEAQPRLQISEDKRHFLAEVHIKCFRRPHELGTIELKYVDKFIFLIVCICYQLAYKTRNLLFAIQLHTYLHNL